MFLLCHMRTGRDLNGTPRRLARKRLLAGHSAGRESGT